MSPSLQNLAAKSIAHNINRNELANLVKNLPFNITRKIIHQTPASRMARNAAAVVARKRAEALMRRMVRRRKAVKKHMVGGRLSNNLLQNKYVATAISNRAPANGYIKRMRKTMKEQRKRFAVASKKAANNYRAYYG